MPRVEFRSISKTYPDGTSAVRELDLAIEDGEFVCILGPSGCGKSSILRMLAGLEAITAGDILVDGTRINDVPARTRDMAMVFENYALYPHLDVYHNIAMPLVARRVRNHEIRDRVLQVCETLRLTDQINNRPRTLSGGQRQRVALGRALIRHPRIFLMDEPLGHLEAHLRAELRAEIRRLHEERGTTTVYITHDQQEAGAIGDRIAVMNEGRLQQVGSLGDLLDWPVNRFVARFIGEWPLNLLPASLIVEAGLISVRVDDLAIPLTPLQTSRVAGAMAEGPLELGVRPDDVHIVNVDLPLSLKGRVAVVEPQGDTSVVVAETAVGRIDAVVPSNEAPVTEATVGLKLAIAQAHLFSADGTNLFAGLGNTK
jgi:multiple sugar transport system ATP-binding protein